jgi:hypothetical protein
MIEAGCLSQYMDFRVYVACGMLYARACPVRAGFHDCARSETDGSNVRISCLQSFHLKACLQLAHASSSSATLSALLS